MITLGSLLEVRRCSSRPYLWLWIQPCREINPSRGCNQERFIAHPPKALLNSYSIFPTNIPRVYPLPSHLEAAPPPGTPWPPNSHHTRSPAWWHQSHPQEHLGSLTHFASSPLHWSGSPRLWVSAHVCSQTWASRWSSCWGGRRALKL